MSGVLRLGNTGGGTGRSTLEASASNDQTFTLPSAGGTLLTSNTSIPGGTITLDGATINITNGDLNVDSGTLFVDESTNRIGFGTTSPVYTLDVQGTDAALRLKGNSNTGFIADQAASGLVSLINYDPTGALRLGTASIEQLRIDNSGRLLIGTSNARSLNNDTQLLQVEAANGSGTGRILIGTNNNTNGTGAGIYLYRSRGGTLGSNTIVQDGDDIGSIYFHAADGTDTNSRVAQIRCEIDGTPGADDVPGRLLFFTTADGGATPTEQLRLNSVGNLGLGTGSNVTSQSGRCFHINGLTGGQARIHLTTSASGSAANEGSYIVALGAESGALAGSLGFENRENRDIFFSVGTTLTERFRIRQATDAGDRLFAGIETSGALRVSNAQYVTRSASNGVGAGIFPSAFGAYGITGFIHAVKVGTTDFCIVACFKRGTTTGVDTTVLANSGGLAPAATNSGGTVTFNDTSSDVKMISIVYLTEWSD